MNADKLDSAEYYATQANRLYAPVALRHHDSRWRRVEAGNTARAVEYWTKAAEAATRTRPIATYAGRCWRNIGSAYLDQANTASGADKAGRSPQGGRRLQPADRHSWHARPVPDSGRQQLQTAYLLAGDTAAAAKSGRRCSTNPTDYEYKDLLNSAVNAARANRSADAGKLFEASLAQNPVQPRRAVQPGGHLPDARAERQGRAHRRRVSSRSIPAIPRTTTLRHGRISRWQGGADGQEGTALAALQRLHRALVQPGQQPADRGHLHEFSPNDKSVTIGGIVTGSSRQGRAFTARAAAPEREGSEGKLAPKPSRPDLPPSRSTLNFDGARQGRTRAVGTQTVTTEPLAPGATAKFNFTIIAPNAARATATPIGSTDRRSAPTKAPADTAGAFSAFDGRDKWRRRNAEVLDSA